MHINVQEGINLCSKNTAMGKEVTEWSQGHMKVKHPEGHGFNGSRDTTSVLMKMCPTSCVIKISCYLNIMSPMTHIPCFQPSSIWKFTWAFDRYMQIILRIISNIVILLHTSKSSDEPWFELHGTLTNSLNSHGKQFSSINNDNVSSSNLMQTKLLTSLNCSSIWL